MLPKDRSIPSLLLIYAAVIGTLVAGVGYGFTKLTIASESREPSVAEKTVLDQRIATARQIKAALHKPVAKPEPLTPITAKRTNGPSAKLVGETYRRPKLSRERPKLSREALDAMAMDSSASSNPVPSSASSYDRAGRSW